MFTLDQTLVLLREGMNRTFERYLSQAPAQPDPLMDLALMTTSRRLQERYSLELMSVFFRRWDGARRFLNAGEIQYTIKNEAFESSIAFDRDQAEDNDIDEKLERLGPMFLAAFEAKKADLLAQLLLNGASQKGYDNQFFFDTDHPVDDPAASGSLQNYWSTGMALTRANLLTVDTAMRTRPIATGSSDLRVVNPRVLIVPLALQDVADQIVNTTEIVDGSGNRLRNTMFQRYRVVVSPRLNSQPTAWYLWDPDYKALILQVRKSVQIIRRDNPQLDNMFHHRQIEIGADGRMGAGYGPWQGIAKAIA